MCSFLCTAPSLVAHSSPISSVGLYGPLLRLVSHFLLVPIPSLSFLSLLLGLQRRHLLQRHPATTHLICLTLTLICLTLTRLRATGREISHISCPSP